MGVRTEILGQGRRGQRLAAAVVRKNDLEPGLAVYTEPARNAVSRVLPFLSPTAGVNMNIDASFGGTPVLVHDGGDNAGWTGTNVIGATVDFASTVRPLADSASVQIAAAALGDVWQFDKGSDLTVTSYVALTLSINVDTGWTAGDSISLYCWDTGSALQIGASVLIENYIDEFAFDTWQTAVIPFGDLDITTTNFDAIRMEVVGKHATSPTWYIDSFNVQNTGGLERFETNVDSGTVFYGKSILFTMVAPLAATLLNNSIPTVAYDDLIGQSLTNGLVLSRTTDGLVVSSLPLRRMIDFQSIGFKAEISGDGTNTTLALEAVLRGEIIIPGGRLDGLAVSISEDLSNFLHLRVVMRGELES